MPEQYPPQYPGPYEQPLQYPSPEQPTYQSPYPSQSMYPPPPPPSQPLYPSQQPGYAPYPQYAPYGMAPSSGTSGWAIASLICGIVGLCSGIAGIAAVVCGHIALSEIKKSNNVVQGRGMAIAGLIMGYLTIAGLIVYIIFMIATFALIPTSVPQ